MNVSDARKMLEGFEKRGMGDRRLVSTGGHIHGDDVLFEESENYEAHPVYSTSIKTDVVYIDYVEENRDGF